MWYGLIMTLRVLFINPWIYDFSAYDFWNKPIGILYLASLLRSSGISVDFIDCLDPYHPHMHYGDRISPPRRKASGQGSYPRERMAKPEPLRNIPKKYNRYGITPEVLVESVRACSRPDIVMITSMMTYWYPSVFETISLIRKTIPGVPVVLGGNYATLCPEHASGSGADFCLPGPGESSLPPLMKTLFDTDVSNLLPYPAFDLIRHPDQLPIMTSRGCPYRCTYCASHLIANRFTRRDPIDVADEIEHWHQTLGVRHFSFYDDALLMNPDEMAIPLLKELIRREMPLRFHTPNGLHLRGITAQLADLLFKAGFETIRFGFETSDNIRQTLSGGKVDNQEFTDGVLHLKRAGYKGDDIGIYLLCGLPGQRAAEVEESIRFVKSSGARPIIAEYSPIPGTDLWNDAVAASPYPIDREPLFHNNSLLPCQNSDLTYDRYQKLKVICR
jgi:radical SAM superfamily enzyme YgiQ (UPF0313 family)